MPRTCRNWYSILHNTEPYKKGYSIINMLYLYKNSRKISITFLLIINDFSFTVINVRILTEKDNKLFGPFLHQTIILGCSVKRINYKAIAYLNPGLTGREIHFHQLPWFPGAALFPVCFLLPDPEYIDNRFIQMQTW